MNPCKSQLNPTMKVNNGIACHGMHMENEFLKLQLNQKFEYQQ